MPLLNQKFLDLNIGSLVEQDTISLLAIPSGSSGFLIIGFQVPGHIMVDDKADIGFIDTETKGIGSYHHLNLIIDKGFLVTVPFGIAQTGMVFAHRIAPGGEFGEQALHFFASGGINNTGVMRVFLQVAADKAGAIRTFDH